MPDMVKKTVKLTKDSTGAPATDLSNLPVDLRKRADKAGVALSKRDLAGIRAQAVMLLDHSGSMYRNYSDGSVQQLVERALGFALQIDIDGTIPVIPFDSVTWPATDVTIENYQGVVDRKLWKPDRMGGTIMAPPLRWIKKMAMESDAPIFLIVVGDGSPQDRPATTAAVCELASYPVFIKFLAVDQVDYLQELDDLPSGTRRGLFGSKPARLLDNVDAKFIPNAASMTDLGFADAMVDEWDTWIAAAKQHGILT